MTNWILSYRRHAQMSVFYVVGLTKSRGKDSSEKLSVGAKSETYFLRPLQERQCRAISIASE